MNEQDQTKTADAVSFSRGITIEGFESYICHHLPKQFSTEQKAQVLDGLYGLIFCQTAPKPYTIPELSKRLDLLDESVRTAWLTTAKDLGILCQEHQYSNTYTISLYGQLQLTRIYEESVKQQSPSHPLLKTIDLFTHIEKFFYGMSLHNVPEDEKAETAIEEFSQAIDVCLDSDVIRGIVVDMLAGESSEEHI